MKITKTKIPDIKIIEPKVFEDNRGFFFESFNLKIFENFIGRTINFFQDNHSKSVKGVVRGLHYQIPPYSQGKLVRVIRGKVFDVAVDIRRSSPTFGQWVGETLSAENKKQLWIPEGFAHGYVTLTNFAEMIYKTTNYYYPKHERCIRWDDQDLSIKWPTNIHPILSSKDNHGMALKDA